MRTMTREELGEWLIENLHTYFCGDCEARIHLEKIVYPSELTCPYCQSDEISINSEDYGKLDI